jgi:hypothetical protein
MEMKQTRCYATGTVTLLWKRNRVHRSCHQGNPKYVTVCCCLSMEVGLMNHNKELAERDADYSPPSNAEAKNE